MLKNLINKLFKMEIIKNLMNKIFTLLKFCISFCIGICFVYFFINCVMSAPMMLEPKLPIPKNDDKISIEILALVSVVVVTLFALFFYPAKSVTITTEKMIDFEKLVTMVEPSVEPGVEPSMPAVFEIPTKIVTTETLNDSYLGLYIYSSIVSAYCFSYSYNIYGFADFIDTKAFLVKQKFPKIYKHRYAIVIFSHVLFFILLNIFFQF